MNYVFIWIQWSGKWTQARLLQENYDFKLFESGWALREIAAEDSELGRSVWSIIDAWNHVSPAVIEDILKDILKNKLNGKSWIFDGFVRNVWNKQTADNVLWDYTVVLFELSEQKAKARLLGRMYNPSTGETFMAWVQKDPNTGEDLIQRADDVEEAIIKRINLYTDLALPLLEQYRKQWNLIEVNADQSIDKVFKELTEKLWLKK